MSQKRNTMQIHDHDRTETLADLSVTELVELLSKRKCSSEEIVRSCLERIERLDPEIRAFVEVKGEAALDQARSRDRAGPTGPLHGIPVAVKDTIDAAGFLCTWGTPIHSHRIPGSDAAVVAALRAAGAIVIGTTVSTEYAIARSGPTRNPHDISRTPGGSSSGSAAAVAARMVPLAIATQTLGSIIRPSIYCGVLGLKPTHGLISTVGMMPLSASCDHVGPMARSMDDIALALRVMSGGNYLYSSFTSERTSEPNFASGMEILRVEGPFADRIGEATRRALDRAQSAFEAAGYHIRIVDLPDRFATLQDCFEAIVFRNMAENHGSDHDRFPDLVSPRFREIIAHGRNTSDAAYQKALENAAYFRGHVQRLLGPGSIILAPATDDVAPPFSDLTGSQMLQSLWSLIGFPTIAVPCGQVGGLPIGVQLIAAQDREEFLMSASSILSSTTSS
jgi:Asp-tRNA(Asn)/Glu-tRNA(Gln) amidotransferase A subunit family amidase